MIAELNKDMQEQMPAQTVSPDTGKVRVSGSRLYRTIKRVFDVTVSVTGGVILLVPMLIVALLIRLESPGPAIFSQSRMGKNGKVFTIYKFRTMYDTAPKNMAASEFHDSRKYITKLGWILRRTSIDEFPQLWNVIRGDMSLVGYRPVCIVETELNELRESMGVFAVRPGITGLAQVSGRDNLDFREKAMLDARYVQSRSVKLDLWCILKTVAIVFSGEGVR